jgi:hypothetical protein
MGRGEETPAHPARPKPEQRTRRGLGTDERVWLGGESVQHFRYGVGKAALDMSTNDKRVKVMHWPEYARGVPREI